MEWGDLTIHVVWFWGQERMGWPPRGIFPLDSEPPSKKLKGQPHPPFSDVFLRSLPFHAPKLAV